MKEEKFASPNGGRAFQACLAEGTSSAESGGSDGLEEGLVSSCALLQGLRREELEMEDQSLPPIEFGIDPLVPGPYLVMFSNELFTHLQ